MKDLVKSFIPEKLRTFYRRYKKQQFLKSIQGDNVFCPVCECYFKYFASFGLTERPNAKCHHCNSLERHRLLFLFLKNKLGLFDLKTNIKLLHCAPEYSFYKIFTEMNNIDYVPCDIAPELYNYSGDTKITKVDITEIPFVDDSFDFIICNQILEHIPDDKQAMKELYRVMKKGGSGIIQVPIDYNREVTFEDFTITLPEDREKAFGQSDHVRWYGKDYPKKLEEVGFKVTADNYVNKFSKEEIQKYCLTPTELIYFCQK